ncbi:transposable element Tc3 transposase [Trichonephila clavipes]|nr:transposable element Tc3 transposase [Trichonephila clavipes]
MAGKVFLTTSLVVDLRPPSMTKTSISKQAWLSFINHPLKGFELGHVAWKRNTLPFNHWALCDTYGHGSRVGKELWFQQDGATCHTARATIDLLKDTFGDRLISRFGPVNWPPRSWDLTPLDYFLWGYVKSLVYVDKPQTLDYLEDNIRRVIADIWPQMLEKSSKIGRPDWTTSEPVVAVLWQKSYLKCNATRLSFE